ncbi:MAG: ABC transporter ATP-binding protein, partial [Microbacterium gubbeenense]
SSHLIDEIANLIERVLVIDGGRILMDSSAEEAREQATSVVGDKEAVEQLVQGREILHRESLGRVASVTFLGQLTGDERRRVEAAGLELAPVPLQQLIVRLTQHQGETARETEGALR